MVAVAMSLRARALEAHHKAEAEDEAERREGRALALAVDKDRLRQAILDIFGVPVMPYAVALSDGEDGSVHEQAQATVDGMCFVHVGRGHLRLVGKCPECGKRQLHQWTVYDLLTLGRAIEEDVPICNECKEKRIDAENERIEAAWAEKKERAKDRLVQAILNICEGDY